MTGLFGVEQDKSFRDATARGITTPEMAPSNFSDVFQSAYDVGIIEDVTGGVRRLQEQYILQQMDALSAYDEDFNSDRFAAELPYDYRGVEIEGYNAAIDFFKMSGERVKELGQLHGLEVETWEDIEARVKSETGVLREKLTKASATASPSDLLRGQMAGLGWAIMHDPTIIATLPIGGVARGSTSAARIFSAMWSEAAILGSLEAAIIQPQIYFQKRSIESPYSILDAAMAATMVAVGGAAFRGILGGSAEGAKKIYATVRGAKDRSEVTRLLREEATRLKEEGSVGEAEVYDDLADAVENTPEKSIDPIEQLRQEQTHLERMDQATDEVNTTGRPAQVETGQAEYDATRAQLEAEGPAFQDLMREQGVKPEVVDPQTLRVDAKTFQFKADTDAEGVSQRLKGVKEWDQISAGYLIVYESADGVRFIADGHQRMGLAKRLIEGGADPDSIQLNAYVLRERDGFTPGMARQAAAMKNIREGTGTALDAAKVLRELGDEGMRAMPSLPPTSALVRDAISLSRLDEEAFAYVANVLKREQYSHAALVGELIEAGPEQVAAIRALIDADPKNLTQARFIVQQIKEAGFAKTETMDLFGGQTISETLFKERAQVLDKALQTIKRNTKTFKNLIQQEEEITGAGNVLERESNIERLSDDEKAIQSLSRLANVKGPISDALNAAARRLKDGEKVGDVSRDFLDTFKRTGFADDSSRVVDGDSRLREQEAQARRESVDQPELGRPVRLSELSESARAKVELDFRGDQQRKVKSLAGLIGKDGKLAERHQKELEAIADELSDELGVEHVRPPEGHKKPAQIERKVKDKYDGDYWQITDVSRTSFVVDNPADAESVIQALGKRLRSVDEDWHLHPDQGYMDRKVLVKYKDGRIGEVQIIGREMYEAKFNRGGHDAYYKWRLTHHQDANGKLVVKDQEAFDSLNKEMADLYEGANQASNREFQSLFESLRASSKTSSTSTVRQRLPGEELDQAVSPPSAGSRTTTTGIPSQESRSTTLSAGGERAVGIDEVSTDILPDDPEIGNILEAEARELETLMRENPDLEIATLRLDEDGEVISETARVRDVMDELAEEDTRTTDMFTCMTGGASGKAA